MSHKGLQEAWSKALRSIDVVMCTCNSNKPWFKGCLKSIKNEIPVHCFILVDCFSTDNTVNAVKQLFPNAKIVQTEAELAQSRKIGFEMVDTPWFGFLDDDIELKKDWYNKIIAHVAEDVGAVAGLAIETHPSLEKFAYLRINDKWMKSRKKGVATKDNPDEIRGLTHNTLCRRKAVSGWSPPPNLVAFEDHHLLRHIVRKGFKWISVSDAQAKHHGIHNCQSEYKKAKWNYAGARYIGATSLQRLLRKAIYIGLLATFASFKIRDPSIITISFSAHLGRIEGYLKWNRYMSSYTNARTY